MPGSESTDSDGTVTRRRLIQGGGTLAAGAAITGLGGAVDDPTDVADEALSAVTPEARAVYMMPLWYWDTDQVPTGRQKMREWLDRAEETGLNTVFAWVESDDLASMLGEPAYAESEYYDFWNPEHRWDPMGELVTEAHQRDIEVHLWYSFTRYKRSALRIPEYNPDLEVLPPGDPDWASVRLEEWEKGYHDPAHSMVGGEAVCVNNPACRDWTLEVLSRAFEQYPGLDGLHIEEPGYLAADRCVCHRCQDQYAAFFDEDGTNLLDHTYRATKPYYDDDRAVRVRCHGTNAFVARLHDWWTDRGTDQVLSFNGSWAWQWDRVRGRNWARWSREGWVPYFFPQIYTDDTDYFQHATEYAMEALGDTVIAPIVGLEWNSGSNDVTTVLDQIETGRASDGHAGTTEGGAGLFSGHAMSADVTVGLRGQPYTRSTSPHWHGEAESDQSRGDMTRQELEEQDPFVFTPHWRDEAIPGSYTGPPMTEETFTSLPDAPEF